VILGSHRRDWIIALAGNDLICGRGGTDILSGNKDDDRVSGGKGGDWLVGGLGNDALRGGKGSDSIDPSVGDDRVDGGPGRWDLVSYYRNDDGGIVVNLAENLVTGWGRDVLRSIEGASSGYGRDTFIGDHKTNLFYITNYGDRPETVSAGGGADWVHVMSGTFHFRADGGRGRDDIGFTFSNDGVDLDLAAGTVRFIGYRRPADSELLSFEKAGGSHLSDILRGDGGSNRLRGFSGHDRLFGAGGNDHLNGWGHGRPAYEPSDYLDGGPGRDHCRNGTRFRDCEMRTTQRR
jgi:Ca2+-binding RTX toxin-like protein